MQKKTKSALVVETLRARNLPVTLVDAELKTLTGGRMPTGGTCTADGDCGT